jgi:ribosomal protein L11 methylase PrmA
MLSFGAVFARTNPETITTMVQLANNGSGKKAVDVGSGDGRLVIAMAKAGMESHGYEINPFLVAHSRFNIKKAGVQGKAFVHWKNFWNVNFSEFDVVTVYGISYIMKKLEVKLKKELKPSARIVSNYFIFSDWQYSQKKGTIYVYNLKAMS